MHRVICVSAFVRPGSSPGSPHHRPSVSRIGGTAVLVVIFRTRRHPSGSRPYSCLLCSPVSGDSEGSFRRSPQWGVIASAGACREIRIPGSEGDSPSGSGGALSVALRQPGSVREGEPCQLSKSGLRAIPESGGRFPGGKGSPLGGSPGGVFSPSIREFDRPGHILPPGAFFPVSRSPFPS